MSDNTTSPEPGTDTLPEWLHQRFGAYLHGGDNQPWDHLPDHDRAYWAHEAAAVQRAVARGGFKDRTVQAEHDAQVRAAALREGDQLAAGLGRSAATYARRYDKAADRLRATRKTLARYRSTLAAVRTAVAEARACDGVDCTIDHRDVILALIDDGAPEVLPLAVAIQQRDAAYRAHNAYIGRASDRQFALQKALRSPRPAAGWDYLIERAAVVVTELETARTEHEKHRRAQQRRAESAESASRADGRADRAEEEAREARQGETEAVRARKAAEDRLRRIAVSGPRADAVQTEIGEMIAQTHDLRDQLQGAEATLARVREVVGEARAVALPWSELDRRLTAIEAALGDTRQRLNAERWRKQAENCGQEHHFTAVEAAPGDPQPTEAEPQCAGCAGCGGPDCIMRAAEPCPCPANPFTECMCPPGCPTCHPEVAAVVREQPAEPLLRGPIEAAAELLINAAVALRNAIGDAS